MARFDMLCRQCYGIEEAIAPTGTMPVKICSVCGIPMMRYYGNLQHYLNLGYRAEKYANQTDRDIAKFQFEHL